MSHTLPNHLTLSLNTQDLLATLRRFPPLEPFGLALNCEQELSLAEGGTRHSFCATFGAATVCHESCRAVLEKTFVDATTENRAVLFQCPVGLLLFAVPFRNSKNQRCCLLVGGNRDEALDRSHLESLANATSAGGEGLLEKLEQLPRVQRHAFEAVLEQTLTLLQSLASSAATSLPLERVTDRLNAVNTVAAEIDRTRNSDEAIPLLGEALVLLFDLPRVVILMAEGERFHIKTALGLKGPSLNIADQRLAEFLGGHNDGKPVSLRHELEALFPELQAERAVCAPIEIEGEILGLALLFDVDLAQRDLLLLEMLLGRVAAKLLRMQQQEVQRQNLAASQRLLTMISELSLFSTREALYRNIVAMCCELLEASRGSLMLIDDSGEKLQIEAAKGINLEVARSTPIRLGEGIAGRVAQSGLHLLVSDIEKDCRVGIPNRPRFKTKSFICIPLKLKDRIIGVLNLADKETGHIFNDTDLKHLHILADHAAQMIDRTACLENAQRLEELAIRDPLTGLYNRRLLETRFQEELSRSSRLHHLFTILMVDLDYFKTYNDLCGHIAGDNALRKVAMLLKKSAREMDIVIRYGGEEFCLLLPSTGKEEAFFVAERIRRTIENEVFPGETGLPLGKLTASIGLASFPDDGDRFENLIHAADIALYQAKSKGRNRLTSFEPALHRLNKKTG